MSHQAKATLLRVSVKLGKTLSDIKLPAGWEDYLEHLPADNHVDKFVVAMEDGDFDLAVSMIKTAMPVPAVVPPPPPQATVAPPPPPAQPVTATQARHIAAPQAPVTAVHVAPPPAQAAAPQAPPPQQAAPVAAPPKPATQATPAAPGTPAPAGPVPHTKSWVDNLQRLLMWTGIGIVAVFVISLLLDAIKPDWAIRIIQGIDFDPSKLDQMSIRSIPYWDWSIVQAIKNGWRLFTIGLQTALVIAGIYQLLALSDTLRNDTRADIAGFVGLVVCLISFGVQRPVPQIGWFLTGQILMRRNRDVGSSFWIIPGVSLAVTFGITLLMQQAPALSSERLTGTLLQMVAYYLGLLKVGQAWLIIYGIEFGFTASYFVSTNVDGSSQGALHMFQATVAAMSQMIPFSPLHTQGLTMSLANGIGIAYIVTNGLLCLVMEAREPTARIAKEESDKGRGTVLGILGTIWTIGTITASGLLVQKAYGWALLWSLIAGSLLPGSLLGGFLLLARLSSKGLTEFRTLMTKVQLYLGDCMTFGPFLVPNSINLIMIVLWAFAMINPNAKLI